MRTRNGVASEGCHKYSATNIELGVRLGDWTWRNRRRSAVSLPSFLFKSDLNNPDPVESMLLLY